MSPQELISILAEAEERLTRSAIDELDIAALLRIRSTLAKADPNGTGKRFLKGFEHGQAH